MENSQKYVNINDNIPDTNNSGTTRPLSLAPLTMDSYCAQLRESCDYSQRITMEVALRGEQIRPVRVYMDGVFDMFHFGHAQAIRQAKTYFKGPVHLIVGVSADEDCERNKRRPILTTNERVNCIRNCIWLDEVVGASPWLTTREFVEKNKIDFVCHGSAPYICGDLGDIFAWAKEANMYIAIKRTNAISTTDIIERIRRKIKSEEEENSS